MNHHSTAHGTIAGIVSAAPARIVRNDDCPEPAAAHEAAKITGVMERRWVREGQTAASLCTAAARSLLEGLGWSVDSIDVIVYVTQTPARVVPADVYSIAADLGATCPCLQVNWSCAGYVYGLWTAMRMLAHGQRALLLVGDANSTISDPRDRATAPLFGDAGTATAIEGGGPEQHFVMGTDGAGAEKLCTARKPVATVREYGEPEFVDSAELLTMDGAAVFNFTLKHVPQLVAEILKFGEPDVFLFHQANRFMLSHLAKKSGVQDLAIPTNIARFGNTSCASIPLLMCTERALELVQFKDRLAMFGFGAGWAWAGASIDAPPMQHVDHIEVA